jgi:hypothetical protein
VPFFFVVVVVVVADGGSGAVMGIKYSTTILHRTSIDPRHLLTEFKLPEYGLKGFGQPVKLLFSN